MNIKEVFKRKTILIALPILILLAAALIAIGITNAANSATEPETEQTFTEDGDGYYIWVRAVDHAGNKGPWSEAQRVWIDSKPPIVTCTETNNTLTITEGDVVTLADYFTVEPNGKNTNITKTCTINGTNYTTTEGITEGTYTVTCTAAKESGLSAEATMTLVVESAFEGLAETTKFTDELGNSYVVPGGFIVRTDLATTVDKGIVIEDSDGNQFVWVPIGEVITSNGDTVNIEFGRYSNFSTTATPAQKASAYTSTVTISSYYQELSTYRESLYASKMANSNATAKSLATFISNAQTNKGYYLARYEASFGSGDKISSVTSGTTSAGTAGVTNQKPAFKQSTKASSSSNIGTVTSTPGMLWNYIRQGDASLACQNLYAGNEYNNQDFVESDLVNSYAWDTAIMFIQKCSDKTDYANQTRLNSTLYNTGTDTGKTTDVVCNIYDMAGNLREWTTEYSSYGSNTSYSCVRRGGAYDYSNYYTAYRYYSNATSSFNGVGFRAVLSCTPVVSVAANQAEVTVNYGDNVSFDSLFTVTTRDGGTSEIYYAVDGINGPLVNCSELEVGTHEVICVATYNGVIDSAYMTVVVKSAEPDFSGVTLDDRGSFSGGTVWIQNVPDGWTPYITIWSGDYVICEETKMDGPYSSSGTVYWENDGGNVDKYQDIRIRFKNNTTGLFANATVEFLNEYLSCFVARTKIFTPSGLVNIEELKRGDKVYSMNMETMRIEEDIITQAYKNTVSSNTCVVLIGENYIESTLLHPYYEKTKGWIKAEELEVGDILIDGDYNENVVLEVIIKEYSEAITVYNFTVENNNNYFVGEERILVHNESAPKPR